nr:immunoglobulin light chain junction region [Macaca mulatta]
CQQNSDWPQHGF